MRIRIVIQQIVRDRIDDHARRLRAACSVKVSDGMIVMAAQERRKSVANFFG